MEKLWVLLEKKIMERFQITAPDWVQVEISKNSKIHVTIVSDHTIEKEDVRSVILDEIKTQNEAYTVGFIDIYSMEEAEELSIEKTKKIEKVSSWADGLNIEEQKPDDTLGLNVISYYSYKGGVGRTVALIQTAYNLARQGKRVLLLDLDIEAPSLHNLFSDQVNDPIDGVQAGIVEYLYHSVVQKKTDISLNEICCKLSVPDIQGEMFLIPALKTMNKQYLYQIGRLQTEKIQEDQVFARLFEEIKRDYAVDMIMIDTRAGFNSWGSLSLLTLSTQVIFVAYPNEENVEGLNVAFEMLDNVGKKQYAVAMSKVVSKEEGQARALTLFRNLHITQDGFLPIYYQEEVALNNRYPITSDKVVRAYNGLSDYILNSERILFNREFLGDGQKKNFLQQLFRDNKKNVRLSDMERFWFQNTQSVMIYHHDIEIEGLYTENRELLRMKGNLIFAIPSLFYVLEDAEAENVFNDSSLTVEQMGIKLIQKALCYFDGRDDLSENVSSDKMDSIEQLLSCLKQEVIPEGVYALEGDFKQQDLQPEEFTRPLKIFVFVTEQVMGLNVESFIEKIKQLLMLFNKTTESIQFKFLIKYSLWEKYQKEFSILKGTVKELELFKRDVQHFLYSNVNTEVFQPYLKAMRIRDGLPDDLKKGNHHMRERDIQYMLDLILGIWKTDSKYSESVFEYLCDFVKRHRSVSYDRLLDVLQIAAKQELESHNTQNEDRLLGFETVQKELEKLFG